MQFIRSNVIALTVLLSCVVAEERKTWTNAAMKVFMPDTDVVTIDEITRNGSAIQVQSCGGADDALKIGSISFDQEKWTLTAHGNLQRELLGGNVTAKIRLGTAPEGATISERMKRLLAFSLGKHTHKEPLCQHFARGHAKQNITTPACPFAPGLHNLHFSFGLMPRTVIAGKYELEIHAVDNDGLKVACLMGSIDVPRGKQGQLFRRLDGHASYSAYDNKYCADPHEYGEYMSEATNLEECASMSKDNGNCGDHFMFTCNDYCWQDDGCTKKSCAGSTEWTDKGSNKPGLPLCVCFHHDKSCEKPHDSDDWTLYKFGAGISKSPQMLLGFLPLFLVTLVHISIV